MSWGNKKGQKEGFRLQKEGERKDGEPEENVVRRKECTKAHNEPRFWLCLLLG